MDQTEEQEEYHQQNTKGNDSWENKAGFSLLGEWGESSPLVENLLILLSPPGKFPPPSRLPLTKFLSLPPLPPPYVA